ncbi:helix-turn-helix transcriptional regulator [Xanthomarina sp. F1114]|uniref:helix-turn-helix domain-containing protein n=1 Tax=Xanthomarina sp. F1114 TaxID=2996019 RepID=UPI00225E0362|nr:helix-turn-helix transcriptional regulator [Xanthomarina sp. F1114]MCX7548050.1 helix-turn-helix transcriptional regulator [Xanthomarina sp. F1114]
MINNEEFAIRLQKVIDFYNENASSFAEKIGVQRSSISHILSGRNKPSLDFVMKVLSAYPEVELYWLLNGKGQFPKREKSQPEEISITETKALKGEHSPQIISQVKQTTDNTSEKTIERIVIFYTDGSFKSFEEL